MPYGPEPAHTLKRAEAHEKIFFLKKDKPEKDAIEWVDMLNGIGRKLDCPSTELARP